MPAKLTVDNLSHSYGAGAGHAPAIADISFGVRTGEIACVVGPSGCGKSTMLRAVAGLIRPSAGGVTLNGRRVDGVPAGMAMVFQDYSKSLYPWLTVSGNVQFPLRNRVSRTERRKLAEQALASVSLADQAHRYPWQLSGGMQQRVAIARALACQPSLLLMDEPFGSVDAQTRAELEDLLLQVRAERDMTVLVVTHDIDESVYLGDQVIVLSRPPSSVRRIIPVRLPAKRDQITTRESEEFVHLRGEVARLLAR